MGADAGKAEAPANRGGGGGGKGRGTLMTSTGIACARTPSELPDAGGDLHLQSAQESPACHCGSSAALMCVPNLSLASAPMLHSQICPWMSASCTRTAAMERNDVCHLSVRLLSSVKLDTVRSSARRSMILMAAVRSFRSSAAGSSTLATALVAWITAKSPCSVVP